MPPTPLSRPSELVAPGGRVYHLGLAPGELATRVVLVGDPARALKVAARFDTVRHEVRRREYVTLTGTYRGEEVSVIGTGIGTDNVEIALVEAHAVHAHDLDTGHRRPDTCPLTFIRVGTSGGAQDDHPPGALAISGYALGLDSTGLFYEGPPADDVVLELERQAAEVLAAGEHPRSRFVHALRPYASRADPAWVRALQRAAARAKQPYATGITGTLPGFYAPSGRYIEGLRCTLPDLKARLGTLQVGDLRLLNFEMESSLLFHLAGQLGHAAATVCAVISAPGTHGSVVDYKPAVEAAIDLSLDTLVVGPCSN